MEYDWLEEPNKTYKKPEYDEEMLTEPNKNQPDFFQIKEDFQPYFDYEEENCSLEPEKVKSSQESPIKRKKKRRLEKSKTTSFHYHSPNKKIKSGYYMAKKESQILMENNKSQASIKKGLKRPKSSYKLSKFFSHIQEYNSPQKMVKTSRKAKRENQDNFYHNNFLKKKRNSKALKKKSKWRFELKIL